MALLFVGRGVFVTSDGSVINDGYAGYFCVGNPDVGLWWILRRGVVFVVGESRGVVSSALLTRGALGAFS
jgi:hypothetical protein